MLNTPHHGMIRTILTIVGAAALLLLTTSGLSAQCEMCRTALTQSPEGLRWSRGINSGIMLLLAAPFLIAACGLAVIYRAQLAGWLTRIRARFAALSTGQGNDELAAPSLREH
jgi:hypothetical protein